MADHTIAAVQDTIKNSPKTLGPNQIRTYTIPIACRNLIGKSIGRLIYRMSDDGYCPTFKDPVIGDEIESCYEPGEVWSDKFGDIATSYEECIADVCRLYGATYENVYKTSGFDEKEAKDILYTNVMNHIKKGIFGLPLYNT